MANEGDALKSDLRLRCEYPHLETRIFEIEAGQHLIYFDRADLDAISVADRFNDEMRPITAIVSISNVLPETYICEIEPISDRAISKDFVALPLTKSDIINLLAACFPDFDLAAVNTVRGGVIEVVSRTQPSPKLQSAVQDFMDAFKNFTTQIRTSASSNTINTIQHHSGWHIGAAKLRPHAPAFVRTDEIFWFDNIDRIYAGNYTFSSIPGTEDLGSACFIDFSYGGEQLNLRHALLFYDTILVTPPIAENQEAWERQRLSREDYLALVDAGRLKFILTQPEERGDTELLEAAYERDPSSLIGRRKAAAVVLRDLVQTNEEYKLSDSVLKCTVPELSRALADQLGWPAEEVAKFLAWPCSSLRQSLPPLMTNGALGLSSFGQDSILADDVLRKTGRDLRLEMMGTGFQTHLAHALNATVIPYIGQPESWLGIYRTIGDRLNFYRSFNNRTAAAWAINEKRKDDRRAVLPPLPLFEFEAGVPIEEFLEITRLGSSRRKGRALITRLADLQIDEREAEVARLAAQARRLRGREAGLFSLESLEDAGPLTDILVGVAAPPLFAMRNLIRRIINLRNYSPSFDRIIDAIEHEWTGDRRQNEDIDFLTKIDRVAQLKRVRIS